MRQTTRNLGAFSRQSRGRMRNNMMLPSLQPSPKEPITPRIQTQCWQGIDARTPLPFSRRRIGWQRLSDLKRNVLENGSIGDFDRTKEGAIRKIARDQDFFTNGASHECDHARLVGIVEPVQ